MARKRGNKLSSLYELTNHLSRLDYGSEERKILYGKSLYLSFLNLSDEGNPILENLEITTHFLYLFDLMDNKSSDFSIINHRLSSKLKKQSNHINRLIKEDISNEKVRRTLLYIGSNLTIQNSFKTIGYTLEDALGYRSVRRSIERWRRLNPMYRQFIIFPYKRGTSVERQIRGIIETEMNQIDIHFRRYLNPS